MGGGPAGPPRYNRFFFVAGQGGSRMFDGAGDRTGHGTPKGYDNNAYQFKSSQNPSQNTPVNDTQSNHIRSGTDPRALYLGSMGGQGGGDGEQGSGVYWGGVGGSYTFSGPFFNKNSVSAHNSTANTHRVIYCLRNYYNYSTSHMQPYSAGGGGWGAAGGIYKGNERFVAPTYTGYGGAGGNAVKMNGNTLTVQSGSTRIFGSIVQ